MSMDEIRKVYDYIKIHRPQETDFETVDVAIRVVTGDCSAAKKEELVNRDDAWLIPAEERGKLAGVKGHGWAQGLSPETISLFQEAVEYARAHASEYKESTMIDDIEVLKKMRNDLINNMNYVSYSNIDNKNDYSAGTNDNNIDKVVK